MSTESSSKTVLTLEEGVKKGIPPAAEELDPIEFFKAWFDAAEESGIFMPESVALATATSEGAPSVRMVLLKAVDEKGFVFFTNYGSRKANELEANGEAALCFHWALLERQVRDRWNGSLKTRAIPTSVPGDAEAALVLGHPSTVSPS